MHSHNLKSLVILFSVTVFVMAAGSCMDDRLVDISYDKSEEDDNQLGDVNGVQTMGQGITCAEADEPTWESPIDTIMQQNCSSCHVETSGYDEIAGWINSGQLQVYFDMGAAHYLDDAAEQESCLRWLEIGAPESTCR